MVHSPRSLYRMFYRSRQTPEVAANLDFVVGQIIEIAIEANRAVGLTGLLLVVQGHFIQSLEGDIDAVRSTYARISMDPRHHDLHVTSQGPATQRLFGEWNMCASALAASDKAILDVLGTKTNFNPRTLSVANTQRLLTTVADIQRRNVATVLVE